MRGTCAPEVESDSIQTMAQFVWLINIQISCEKMVFIQPSGLGLVGVVPRSSSSLIGNRWTSPVHLQFDRLVPHRFSAGVVRELGAAGVQANKLGVCCAIPFRIEDSKASSSTKEISEHL